MKGVTGTLKSLKEHNKYFKENDINTKELFASVIEFLDYVNTLLN